MAEELSSYEFQEKLQAYIVGDLNESQKTGFEKEYLHRQEVQETIRFSKDLDWVLKNQELLEVNQQIEAIINKPLSPNPKDTGFLNFNWGLGLVIAIGSVLLFFTYRYNQKAEQRLQYWKGLTQEHVVPLESVLATDNENAPLLNRGMEAYKNDKFQEAEEILTTYWQNNPDQNVGLYLGIVYLLNGDAPKAVEILSKLEQSEGSPIEEATRWYLALAQLRTAQPKAAKSNLLTISQTGAIYKQRAFNLLQELEE